jgi:hypothetical protein
MCGAPLYLGNDSVANINSRPADTDNVVIVVTDVGVITLGSISANPGDVIIWDVLGAVWIRIKVGVGGFVPDGTILVAAPSSFTPISPLTVADHVKTYTFDGTSNSPTGVDDADGTARVDAAELSPTENYGYVKDGVAPSGEWINVFTGVAGVATVTAGDGLSNSGTATNPILDINPGSGMEINTDTIAVLPSTAGGNVNPVDISAGTGWDASAANSASVQADGSGNLEAIAPNALDFGKTGIAATALGDQAGGAVIGTPAGTAASSPYFHVKVNGKPETVGDGVKTDFFYFSADGGTTAKALSAIAAGDLLYLGSGHSYDIDTNDCLDYCYLSFDGSN